MATATEVLASAPPATPAAPPRRRAAMASVGPALALGAAALAALSGPGYRWGLWDFPFGIGLLRWAGYLALAAAVLSLAGLGLAPTGPRRALAAAGLVVALATAWFPWHALRLARAAPAIHDITTDTDNPPAFVDILPLRRKALNPAAYGGPEVAAQQRRAYPDIRPLLLPVPPPAAFQLAMGEARALGWSIVGVDRNAGRIEASDRSFWFGFTDDVVIRLTPASGGTRVDARSVSRVGRGDLGVNARRLRRYLAALARAGGGR